MNSFIKNKYVVINDETQSLAKKKILQNKAFSFTFPLSKEDRAFIDALENAYDNEERIAGLAAVQIGINKQAIIFAIPEEIKNFRDDFTTAVPKTIWLNPSYEPIDQEQVSDYEGCFSVKDIAGKVSRFVNITYEAFLMDGSQVQGSAHGYTARVIQHEIDHINGILFIDKTPKDQLLSMKEYYKIRDAKMNKTKK